jgi:hypothetical protein
MSIVPMNASGAAASSLPVSDLISAPVELERFWPPAIPAAEDD